MKRENCFQSGTFDDLDLVINSQKIRSSKQNEGLFINVPISQLEKNYVSYNVLARYSRSLAGFAIHFITFSSVFSVCFSSTSLEVCRVILGNDTS